MKFSGSTLSWRIARTALSAAPALLLSACMVGPDFSRPAAPASRHYDLQAERSLAAPSAAGSAQRIDTDRAPTDDWWTVFGSPKLDQLMRQAVAGNLDLDAADATIAQANEAVAAVGGGLWPQVDVAAQGGRQYTGRGATATRYAVGPQVSFDFDLFGGNRRRIEAQAALAELQRHRFDAGAQHRVHGPFPGQRERAGLGPRQSGVEQLPQPGGREMRLGVSVARVVGQLRHAS